MTHPAQRQPVETSTTAGRANLNREEENMNKMVALLSSEGYIFAFFRFLHSRAFFVFVFFFLTRQQPFVRVRKRHLGYRQVVALQPVGL